MIEDEATIPATRVLLTLAAAGADLVSALLRLSNSQSLTWTSEIAGIGPPMTSDSKPMLVDFGLNDSCLSNFYFTMLLSCNFMG